MATERTCAVADCGRTLTGRGEGHGMCSLHYQRWRKHGDVNHSRPGRAHCAIPGCTGLVIGRGWCSKHYTRWRRYGDPEHRMPGEIRNGKKICRRCGIDKPVAAFCRPNDPCRSCQAEEARAYRSANPDYWRQPYNPERGRAKTAAWRRANPDKARAQVARRRALRREAAIGDPFTPLEVFERDSWVCGICSDPIDPALRYPSLRSASLDHVIPLALGGEHSMHNTQAAHLDCNLRKGARVDSEGAAA